MSVHEHNLITHQVLIFASILFFSTEEVVESGGSRNSLKFLRSPRGHEPASQEAQKEDDCHWLSRDEFVDFYRSSALYKQALESMEEIEANEGPPQDKVPILLLTFSQYYQSRAEDSIS